MKIEKKFSRTLKDRIKEKQDYLEKYPAVFGNELGEVTVPNQPSFNYVQIGTDYLPVYNNRVPAKAGVKIWVGYASEDNKDNKKRKLFQVLSTRSESPTGANAEQQLGFAPSKRYEWNAPGGGQDMLNVHPRALSFLKIGVSPTGGLNIDLYRGTIWNGTDFIVIPRQDIDITAHIPSTAGQAALVLVTIDNDGAVVTTKGTETDIANIKLPSPLPDVIPHLPAVPADTAWVSGAVRVYNGQTAVKEGRANTDFVDLRFCWRPASSGGSAPTTTAANDMQVGDGAGAWIKKTLAEVKTIFGLGDAAYKNTGTAAGSVAAGDDSRFLKITPHAPGGRPTLLTGVPIMPSEQAAKTTIYYTPCINDIVPIYDGAAWAEYNVPELSLALDADSGHANYHQSGKIFELFVANDGGTFRFGTGPAWASSTSRGTGAGTCELERLNGIMVNKNSMTLRFGSGAGDTLTAAARTAVSVGCAYMSANGTTSWELGGAASGGDPGNLLLSSRYNKVRVDVLVKDNKDSWATATGWQEKDNSTGNQVNFVSCDSEHYFNARNYALFLNSAGATGFAGIGYGAVNALSGLNTGNLVYSAYCPGLAEFSTQQTGYGYIAAIEYGNGGSVTAYGDFGVTFIMTGLSFSGWF